MHQDKYKELYKECLFKYISIAVIKYKEFKEFLSSCKKLNPIYLSTSPKSSVPNIYIYICMHIRIDLNFSGS